MTSQENEPVRGQRQSGGDASANIQAGHDVVIHKGLSAEEARSIALDVFHANFLKLRDVAEEVAVARAEKITRDFLDQLLQRQPDGLGQMQDPDVLQAVFNAQSGYVRSGDEDLEQALIDLLVDRAGQEVRDIKAVVLNEAIATLPKLTADQRSAIAVCFLVRYTMYSGPLELPAFYAYLDQNLAPLADEPPRRKSAYQHIQYTGTGSLSAFTVYLENVFSESAKGFFTRGL
jgi:hypothetical protein